MADETLAQRIVRLRKARGWSQVELSAEAEVSRFAITAWEHGRKMLTIEHFARLAAAFGLTMDELYRGEGRARLMTPTAPPTALTRSVLLRSQPITAGDSTSDREVRDATAPRKPGQPLSSRQGHRLTGGPVGRQTRPDELRGRPCGIIAARALPATSRATTR